jgi:hypothetical protein
VDPSGEWVATVPDTGEQFFAYTIREDPDVTTEEG